MEHEKTELVTLVTKWYLWASYILLGVLGKISYDLVRGRKISLIQSLGSTGISIFVGVLASMWCVKHSPDNGAFIVPVATLLSDKIFTALFAMDLKKISADILGYWQAYFSKK